MDVINTVLATGRMVFPDAPSKPVAEEPDAAFVKRRPSLM